MKLVLRDHGKIIHWAGGRHLFPVKGPGANELAFATHGALEGRTPIGWHEFFPALHAAGAVVVADEDEGTATVLAESEAIRQLGDAAKEKGFFARLAEGRTPRGSDAKQDAQEPQ